MNFISFLPNASLANIRLEYLMRVRRSRKSINGGATWKAAAVCTLGMLGLTSAVAAAPTNATPPDSFLTTQVQSVNELVYEVNSSPKIAARYGKLFHLPSSEVASYFRHNLVISTLSHDYNGPVYSVRPSSGRIFVIREHIKAGTSVYSLRDGQPVLKWACGNPLSTHLPAIATAAKPKPAAAATVPTINHVASNPGQPVQVATNVYTPPTDVQVPFEQVSPYAETLPPVAGPADFSVPVTSALDFHLPVGYLAALPIGYLATKNSGGSGSAAITPPTPAPEGNGLVMWCLGAVALGWAFIAGRRKNSIANVS